MVSEVLGNKVRSLSLATVTQYLDTIYSLVTDTVVQLLVTY